MPGEFAKDVLRHGWNGLCTVDVMKLIFVMVAGLLAAAPAYAVRVSLYNTNGRYVSADAGGGRGIHCNSFSAGGWSSFDLQDLNGGDLQSNERVCLKTYNGHYVVAESGGGSVLNANRRSCGDWEKFSIHKLGPPPDFRPVGGRVQSGDWVAIESLYGQWVSCERDREHSMTANRNSVGYWERFIIKW